jgi:multidrug efflux pump subunit AcrA (membrane-fusion protein)
MKTTTQTSTPPSAQPTAPPERSPYDKPESPHPKRRKMLLVVGALVVLLIAVGLGWTLFKGNASDAVGEAPPAAAPGEPAPAQAGGGAAGEEAGSAGGLAAKDLDGDGIVYQSGMHPWIVEDEPGQCPICGMDLVPVQVSGVEEGTVQIDPVTMQNIGVRTTPVEVQTISRDLRTTGVFEASDRAREAVSLKIGGWVEELYVDAEGDRVRAGQPLLALYSPQLVSTQEEYLLALRSRDLMGSDGDRVVEAARRRLLLFDISPEQIERLETTGEVTRTLTIYAPTGGTVVEKRVVEGMQAMPGMTLMEIVDLSGLWLQVDVPEQDLGWVDVGTRAVVTVESRPGDELRGRVGYVYDLLDPATRTATARIEVANPGGRLKPGMFALATLYGRPTEPAPVVPSEAVIRTGDEAVVILALGDGRFAPRRVTLGIEADDRIQILDGLEGGESVVTSAQFLIDSEARLAASIGAMASAGAAPDAAPAADRSALDR